MKTKTLTLSGAALMGVVGAVAPIAATPASAAPAQDPPAGCPGFWNNFPLNTLAFTALDCNDHGWVSDPVLNESNCIDMRMDWSNDNRVTWNPGNVTRTICDGGLNWRNLQNGVGAGIWKKVAAFQTGVVDTIA